MNFIIWDLQKTEPSMTPHWYNIMSGPSFIYWHHNKHFVIKQRANSSLRSSNSVIATESKNDINYLWQQCVVDVLITRPLDSDHAGSGHVANEHVGPSNASAQGEHDFLPTLLYIHVFLFTCLFSLLYFASLDSRQPTFALLLLGNSSNINTTTIEVNIILLIFVWKIMKYNFQLI